MFQEVKLLCEWQLHCTANYRQYGKHDEREQHDLWALMWLEIAMCAMVMRMIFPLRFAVKHHDHLACHVVRGEQRGNKTNDIEAAVVCVHVEQNFVFRPETCKRRNTSNCQPADDEGDCSNWHQFAQCTHTTHVLLVMHAMNDRT